MIQYGMYKELQSVFEDGQLPVMVYLSRQDFGDKKVARPLHSHDSVCELGLVFKGAGTYVINQKVYDLVEGDLIFHNQKDRHEVTSGTEQEIGTYFFGITNLKLKGMPVNHFVKEDMEYVKKSGSLFSFLLTLCDNIYQLNAEGSSGNASAQLLCSSFVTLANRLENFRYANLGNSEEDEFVTGVARYLDENYTEEITLKQLAEKFRCSPSYISHTFKRMMGSAPIQYIIRRRMGLAQNLLISTDMTATQIAAWVGYDNSNYFTSLFLKVVGVTPIEYRIRYLKNLKGKRIQM